MTNIVTADDLAELKRLAELVPPVDENRCFHDPEGRYMPFKDEVIRLFGDDIGMAKAFVAQVERLSAESAALLKAVNFAADTFRTITSSDGSGHADLSDAMLRIAGPAMSGDDLVCNDAERYRWLRSRLIGVLKDWDDSGQGMLGLSFKIPGAAWRGIDENIDAAMAGGAHP